MLGAAQALPKYCQCMHISTHTNTQLNFDGDSEFFVSLPAGASWTVDTFEVGVQTVQLQVAFSSGV